MFGIANVIFSALSKQGYSTMSSISNSSLSYCKYFFNKYFQSTLHIILDGVFLNIILAISNPYVEKVESHLSSRML